MRKTALVLFVATASVLYARLSAHFGHARPDYWFHETFDGLRLLRSTQSYGALRLSRELGEYGVVHGINFRSGLGVHAFSTTEIEVIQPNATKLVGNCGYPDFVYGARVRCTVSDANDGVLFESHWLSDTNRLASFSVPVAPGTKLVLRFSSPTDEITAAHGSWLDLKVSR